MSQMSPFCFHLIYLVYPVHCFQYFCNMVVVTVDSISTKLAQLRNVCQNARFATDRPRPDFNSQVES